MGNRTTNEAELKEEAYIKTTNFITDLNSNIIEIRKQEIDITNWKKWKLGENGYPTFE